MRLREGYNDCLIIHLANNRATKAFGNVEAQHLILERRTPNE